MSLSVYLCHEYRGVAIQRNWGGGGSSTHDNMTHHKDIGDEVKSGWICIIEINGRHNMCVDSTNFFFALFRFVLCF